MSRPVELQGTGLWRDRVGIGFERTAEAAVSQFSQAQREVLEAMEHAEKEVAYQIAYRSPRDEIDTLRVDYDGR